ncbi:MAG: FliM/FliN family flagellar motor switch protein [Sedimentisphaerales bacterium]|nr:FliM/FliN family flagellar motor switch protein [Sedimentisphaerales bacterium]
MAQSATVETTEEKQDSKKNVQTAEFPEAAEVDVKGSGGSIDILLDMNVPITVTIGQTSIPVRRLLQLAPGSVIKLNKSLDEPVELYLSGSKFATGSVVVVDGCFAVKIKQIIGLEDSPEKNN